MNDRSLGLIIFAIGLVGAVVYSLWLFWPVSDPNNILFYLPGVGRWAIVLPLFVAVIAIFAIAVWIGWTMAVTPPPAMIEEPEAKTEEKKEGT